MHLAPSHRKRRANSGRLSNAMVIVRDVINVSDTHGDKYSADSVVVRSNDVSRQDGYGVSILDESSEHRNRFGADHRVSIVAPDIAPCRRLLDKIRHTFGDVVKFDQQIGQYDMITIKVQSGAREMLRFINGSKYASLFQVEATFCGDRDSMCATTMRHTHGRFQKR